MSGWNEGERFAECSLRSLHDNPQTHWHQEVLFLHISLRESAFSHPSFIMFITCFSQPPRQHGSGKVFSSLFDCGGMKSEDVGLCCSAARPPAPASILPPFAGILVSLER